MPIAGRTFLNAEIVKQGYGHAYVKYRFKYLDQFRGSRARLTREQHHTRSRNIQNRDR
jgi:hypothetical protein